MNVATVAPLRAAALMRADAMRVLVLLRPTMARFAPSAASASAAANPMPLLAPVIRICLSFTAHQSKALATLDDLLDHIQLLARERDQPLDVIGSAAGAWSASMRNKKILGKEPRNPNAGHSDRHERARAELTGAAGSYTSSTRRVRHCWLADIDLAPALVRHNHAVSWIAGDDTGRLHGPRVHPRGHGGAIDCGSRRTCFPAFYHDATLAD